MAGNNNKIEDLNSFASEEQKKLLELSKEEYIHLQAASEIDKQILEIQKSTRTAIPQLSKLHNYFRMHFAWYYRWSQKTISSSIHIGILIAYILGVSGTFVVGSMSGWQTSDIFKPLQFVRAASIDISGTCKQYDQTTNCADSETIKIAVNGTPAAQTGTTSSGSWTISGVTVNDNDVLTVWIDGVADANEAVSVIKLGTASNVTGAILYERHLTLGASPNQTISNANISQYDNSVSGDEDIFIEVDASDNLLIPATSTQTATDQELYILASNTYRPNSSGGKSAKMPNLEIPASATLTADSNTIELTAAGTPFTKAGTFTYGTSTFKYSSADDTNITVADYYTLESKPSSGGAGGGGWSISGCGDSSYNGNYSASGTYNGQTSYTNGSKWLYYNWADMLGSYHWALGGSAGNCGDPAMCNAYYQYPGASLPGTWYAGFDYTGTPSFSELSSSKTHTLLSGTYNIYGNFTAGDGTNGIIVDANANDPTINVDGNFTISAAGAQFTASNSGTFTIAGNFANSGAFVDSSGTVTFDKSSGTQTINTGGTGSNQDFQNVTKSQGGTGQVITNNIKINGTLTINSSNIFDINGKNLTLATLSNAGTFKLQGGETATITTMDTDSGEVEYSGTSTYTSLPAGNTYYDLEINGSGGSFSPSATVTVNNDLLVTAGTLAGTQSINVNGGDATGNGTVNLTDGTFRLDGTGNFGGTTNWSFKSLTFGDGTGAATSTKTSTNQITVSSVLTIAANQTLDAGDDTWVLSGGGTPFVKTGTFTASTSTLKYTANSDTTIAAATYYHLDTSPADEALGGYSISGAGDSSYNGTYSASGTHNGQSSYTNGSKWLYYNYDEYMCMCSNWVLNTSVTDMGDVGMQAPYYASSTITGTWNYNYMAENGPAPSVSENSASANYTLASGTITVGGNWTIGDGTHTANINANTNDPALTVTGSFTNSANATFVASNSGATNLNGNIVLNASSTFTHSSGTVTLNGSGAQTVTMNGTDAAHKFNNLTITNVSASGVEFADSMTIDGTLTDTTASSKITFHSGSTYSVNAISLNGQAEGTRITLTSSTASSAWNLNITAASPAASYVSVRDSNANKSIDATTGCYNATGNTNWTFTAGSGITVSGTVYTAENKSTNIGTNKTVALSVNGAAATTVETTSGGAFSFSAVTVGSNNTVALFLDGETEKASYITQATNSLTDITGLELYTSHIILSHQTAGPMTNTLLDTADNVADTDLLTSVSSGNVTFTDGMEVWIWSGKTFTPGGNVTAGGIDVLATSTFSPEANTVTLTGAGTPFAVEGTFNESTSTFAYTGASATNVAGTTYNNLTLNHTGTTFTSLGSTTVKAVLTITAGTFDASSQTIILSGSSTPFVVNGTFTASTSTIRYTGTGATNIAAATYYNLEAKAPSGSPTYTMASGTVNVGNNYVNGDGTNTITVNANTNDPTFNIDGNFTIAASSTFVASNSGTFSIAGNFVNSGTFTHSSGTITFDGSGTHTMNTGGTGAAGGWIVANAGDNSYNGTYTASGTMNGYSKYTNGTNWLYYNFASMDSSYQWALNTAASDCGDIGFCTSYYQYPGATTPSSNTWYASMNFSGTPTLSEAAGGGSPFNNITTSGTGTLQIITKPIKIDGTLTTGSGTTFDLNGQNLTVATLANNGTFKLQGAETTTITSMDTDSGTVEYSGSSSYTSLSLGDSYYGLKINGSGTWTLDANLAVAGVLNIAAGALNASTLTITLSGSGTPLIVAGTFTESGSTVIYTGASATNVTGTTYNNLKLNHTGTTFTAAGGITANGVFTIQAGTFDASSQTITLNAGGTPLVNTGSFTASTSTVKYAGPGDTNIADLTYYNMVFDSASTGVRKPISITNSSGGDLTDYQVKVSLTSSNFDFSASTLDGDDIRFKDSNGSTNLNYWIESWDSVGQKATIWVKVPSVPTTGATIYMHYGDGGLAAASNGAATFDLFDDFDNLNNWTQEGTSISVSNSVVTLDNNGGTAPSISRTFDISSPFTAEAKYQRPYSNRNRMYLTTSAATGSPTGSDYGDFGQIYWQGEWTGTTLSDNTWYTTRWYNTPSNYTWQFIDSAGNTTLTRSTGSAISNLSKFVFTGTESTSSDLKFDWVRIRKYASAEPAATVGTEASAVGVYSFTGNSTVNNDLTTTSGTLKGSTRTITLKGDWLNNGAFTKETSTLTLAGIGAQQITAGGDAFNNLTVTNASTAGVEFLDAATVDGTFTATTASSKVTFHSGATYAFNAISINGQATGTRVTLTSSTGGSAWNLNITASSPTASNVWVKDSNANKDIDATTGGYDGTGNTHWLFPASGATISGTVYTAENKGTNIGADKTIALSINGAAATTAETTSGGVFSFSNITVASNNTIALFIDGETEKGSFVTQASGTGDITGIEMYTAHIVLSHETAGPMTNTLLATADDVADSDLLVSIDGSSNATFTDGNTIWILGGKTYTPGGNVTAGSLNILSTATFSAGSYTITLNDSGTPFTVGGTFTEGTSTIKYTGSSATNVAGTTFNNLTLDYTGTTFTAAGNFTVKGILNINAGTLDASNRTININGTGTPFVKTGTFTASTSTVIYDGQGTTNITAATYNNLTTAPATTATYTFASGTININGNYTNGDGTNSVSITADTNDPTLNVDGNFSNAAGASFTASVSAGISVASNFTNSATGTFTDSGATVTLDGQGLQTITAGGTDGDHDFYNITITNASTSGVSFADSLTLTGTFTDTTASSVLTFHAGSTYAFANISINGQASTTRIKMYSSSGSTAWYFNVSQTSPVASNVDVKGSNANGGNLIDATTGGLDNGGNFNWNFAESATGYTVTGTVFTNDAQTTNIGANKTIAFSINGGAKVTAETDSGGSFQFLEQDIALGDTIILFVDDETEKAAEVSKVVNHTGDYTGFALVTGKVKVNHFGGSEVTNANLSTAYLSDSDLLYTVSGSDATFSDSATLWVRSDRTYRPGGNVTMGNMSLVGTFSPEANSVTVHGSWAGATGTFTAGTSTATFSASSGTKTIDTAGDSFNNLVLNDAAGTATYQITSALDVNGTFTLTDGVLDLDTSDPTVNLAGNVTINGGSITKSSTDALVTLDGDLTYDDNVGVNLGDIQIGTSPDTTNLSSDMTADTVSVAAGDFLYTNGYDIDCNGNLTIAATGTLDATDDVELDGTTINVAGNWSNSGTFTAATSTVIFDAGDTGHTIADGGSNWNHVTFNGSGGGWSFSDATVIGGDLTVTAGTLSGTNNITVNGGDATGNGTINLTGGAFLLDATGNFGGTTNWTFYDLTFGDGSGTATSTKTSTNTITTTHVLTIAANQTLDAGDDTWVLSGSGTPFVKTGIFTYSTSTVKYTGTGDTTVAAVDYYNLETSPSSGTGARIIDTSSSLDDVTFRHLLDEGSGTNANDLSSNNLDGTLSGLGASPWVSGGGVQFNGSGVITLPNNSAINPTSAAFSLAAWVNISAYSSSSGDYYILGVFDKTGPTSGYFLRIGAGAYATRGRVAAGINNGSWRELSSDSDVGLDGWHLIGMSYDGSSLKVCLDGTVKSASYSGDISASTNILQLGSDQRARYFTGQLRQPQFYPRALTADEWTALAASENAGTVIDTADYTFASGTININGDYTNGDGTHTVNTTADTNDPILNIDGNYSNAAGASFTASASAALSVASNFTNSATGTYIHSSATLTMDGQGLQTVTAGGTDANHDFNNLTITNASTAGVEFADSVTLAGTFTDTTASSKLTFHAGDTYTFANISISGQAIGTRIVMQSSTNDTHWHFNVAQTTPSASYVNVRDSDASGGNAINARTGGLSSGGNTNWIFGIAISGTVYTAENKSTNIGADKTVAFSVNGGAVSFNHVETTSGGVFSMPDLGATTNDVISIFLSGETEKASLILQAADGTSNITGLELYTGHVVLTYNTAGPMTNTLLATADDVADSDLLVSVDGSNNATMTTANEVWILGGKTYTPGGNVTMGSLDILSTATFTPEANTITFTDSGTPFAVNGTFNEATSTVIYTGSSATNVTGTTYNNLKVNQTGTTFTSAGNSTVKAVFTIQAGTFDASDDTLTLSGSGTPFVKTGTFTASTSTVKYDVSLSTTVTAADYYHLELIDPPTSKLTGNTKISHDINRYLGLEESLGQENKSLAESDSSGLFAAKNGEREVKTKRTRSFKTFDRGDGTYRIAGDTGPIHYKNDPYDQSEAYKEIDLNLYRTDFADYDYAMEQNGYQAYFWNNKSETGTLYTARFKRAGHYLDMAPISLIWQNNLGQRELVSEVQPSVQEPAINNNAHTIKWSNVFGDGIDFAYNISPDKFFKTVIINNPEALKKPSISEEGLRLTVLMSMAWDTGANLAGDFANGIETKLSSKTSDEVSEILADPQAYIATDDLHRALWSMPKPLAWDSDQSKAPAESEWKLLRSNNSIIASISIPDEFIVSGRYPLYIDATMSEEQTGASGDDGTHAIDPGNISSHYFSTAFATRYFGYYAQPGTTWQSDLWERFTTIPIPQGSTIDTATISVMSSASQSNSTVNARIYANDADDATAPTTHTEYDNLSWTTDYADWNNIGSWNADTWYQTPDISAPFEEVMMRTGWASDNDIMFSIKDNASSSNAFRWVYTYDQTGNVSGPKLNATYTEPKVLTMASGTFNIVGNLTIGNGTDATKVTADTNDPVINVDGNFNITANATFIASASATFSVASNYTNSATGTFTHSSGTITFDGQGAQSITSGGDAFNNVIISNTSAEVSQADAATIAGTLTTNASTIYDINGQNITLATLSNDGTFRLQGGETTVTVTNKDTNSGTIEYDGSGTYTSLLYGTSYYSMSLAGSGSWTLAATTTVTAAYNQSAGTLTIGDNTNTLTNGTTTITGGTLTISNQSTNRTKFITGNFSLTTGTLNNGNYCYIDINGTLTQNSGTITNSATAGRIYVSGNFTYVSGTYPIVGSTLFDGNSASVVSAPSSFGIFTLAKTAGQTLTLSQDVSIAVGYYQTSGSLDCNGYNVIMSGNSSSINGNGSTIQNLKISGTAVSNNQNVIISNTLVVDEGKKLVMAAGSSTTMTLTDAARLTLNGTIDSDPANPGRIVFTDDSGTNLPTGGTLSGRIRFLASAKNITVPARTYGGRLDIQNDGSSDRTATLGTASSQTITVGGGARDDATMSGLIIITNGTGKMIVDATTYNPNVTVTTSNNAWNYGDINFLGSGSGQRWLKAGSGTWTVSGDIDCTNGTLTAGSSTFILNGANAQTQNITSASQQFYNLTIQTLSTVGAVFADSATITGTLTDVTPSSKITFHAGSTYTVANINLNGQATGTRLLLQSSTTSAWLFNVSQSSPTASYVNVSYSNASGGNTIQATTGCNDGGNNQNWNFYSPNNSSLTFTNPYSGTSKTAVADNTTEWNFQAIISDADGATNINYVELHLANNSDSAQPYDSLKFRWTEATDTFSEEADTQSAATITSTSSNSTANGNEWTLDFKIKFDSPFATKDTDYAAELVTVDDATATDMDNYVTIYNVTALSLTLDLDQDSINFGNTDPDSAKTGTTVATVSCNHPNGYSLSISDGVDGTDSALKHTDNSTRIADYAGTITTPTLWSGYGLGFSVFSATGKDTGKWGTGTTETDSNNKYAGIPKDATIIHSKTASPTSSDQTYIGYKILFPNTQKTGAYSGDVTYTATGVLN